MMEEIENLIHYQLRGLTSESIIKRVKTDKLTPLILNKVVDELIESNNYEKLNYIFSYENIILYGVYTICNKKIYFLFDEFFEKNGTEKLFECYFAFPNICIKHYFNNSEFIKRNYFEFII
jgi:hypothetical protein